MVRVGERADTICQGLYHISGYGFFVILHLFWTMECRFGTFVVGEYEFMENTTVTFN
jgi:hypothetical protein